MIPADLAEKFSSFIVNRRDKRIITFGVLTLYCLAVLWNLVGPMFGLKESKLVMDSIEALAMVVVVAHIVGSVATRHSATKTITEGKK